MSTVTTTVCLVRHGETDWNLHGRYQGWADIPLNQTGVGQARVVGTALAAESWDAIVSSPLSRAMQTAQAIVDASTRLPDIVTDANLRERGYGEAEGMTLEEREARWSGQTWPGLEPLDVMTARAMTALNQVVEQNVGGRVLVVCHGGLINAVLKEVSGGEVGTGVTIILNTSRSILLHGEGSWQIDTVTDASHLELAGALEH